MKQYQIAFSKKDVADWAEFSGDYNPIHFDLDRVRKLGLQHMVVHGMLAIMPVKNTLSEQFNVAERIGWVTFKGMFSQPIPQDEAFPVNISERKGKLRFSVRNFSGDTEYLKGHFAQADNPLQEYANEEVVLSTDHISNQYMALFQQHYGIDYPLWIVLDNIVFADFVNSKVQPLKTIINPENKTPTKIEDSDETIMHLSHTVSFEPEFVEKLTFEELRSGAVSYEVVQPELIRSEGNTVCSLTLLVKVGSKMCMLVQMKLIIKQPGYESR